MSWEQVVQNLGGTAFLLALIYFLGRRAIDAFVAGRIASYKAELDRVSYEHQIKFQSLHAERAECIKSLYAKIAFLDDLLYSTLRSFQSVADKPLTQKVSELADLFNDLRTYYLPRKIFFSKDHCEQIEKIIDLSKGIFFDITTYPVDPCADECKYNPGVLQERHEFWEKARAAHADEFVAAKASLEGEFRSLLGIRA